MKLFRFTLSIPILGTVKLEAIAENYEQAMELLSTDRDVQIELRTLYAGDAWWSSATRTKLMIEEFSSVIVLHVDEPKVVAILTREDF